MPKNHKTFEDLIVDIFTVFAENRLSLDEISKTYNIDIQFLKALLNNDKLIIRNISKLIESSNIKLSYRRYAFNPFSHRERDSYIKITRKIKPFCSIIYDKKENEWHSLKPKNKNEPIGHNKKYLLLDDFKNYKKNTIDRINTKK